MRVYWSEIYAEIVWAQLERPKYLCRDKKEENMKVEKPKKEKSKKVVQKKVNKSVNVDALTKS